jgi:D-serine deaminase-like pyridoxal phosphate-dependent protein
MLSAITRPTAILNESIARTNIRRMAEKARQQGVQFRPHFKTHQSAVIGDWFREAGVQAITVSSVEMAAYFAAHGWTDITIAFPVNWREIAAINDLAGRVDLGLVVESVETAEFLAANLSAPVGVWLKIDTGYHRTGIPWDNGDRLRTVAAAVQDGAKMALRGLLTHAGHSYGARTPAELQTIYDDTVQNLAAARIVLAGEEITGLTNSLGDTPCCSVVQDFSAVEEIRPGNFVFYDLTQVQIGACQREDIAVAVACPVVALHPDDHKIVIYGGGVHLSKEALVQSDGSRHYGELAIPTADGWQPFGPENTLVSLSQEHGIIHASAALMSQVKIGDLLLVLPVHSCMTVNLLKQYHTLEGQIIPMLGWAGV